MIVKYKYVVLPEQRKVIAISRFAGKTVRGVAKCAENDEWDVEKGKLLAAARCNLKVAEKRMTRANLKVDEAWMAMKNAENRFNQMDEYLADSEYAYNDALDEIAALLAEM